MTLKFVVAVLAIVALPLCAQAQQPKAAPKPTKADAQRVIKIVSADKAKTKAYCDIADLGDQIADAADKKDEAKVQTLFGQVDELSNTIGPEYIALIDGLQELDPNSKDSQDIGGMLEALDKLCKK